MSLQEEIIRKLPKVDLHCHLDGSLRIETMIDIAEKEKISLPSKRYDDLEKMIKVGDGCRNLEDYLDRFEITLNVMQSPEALSRIAYELIEDAHTENVKYMEVRYSPILHLRRGMNLTETVDSVIKGLKSAERDFGVNTGIIICGIRNISPDISLMLAELAVAYKNRGVVAFDLAGIEENYPAKHHRESFFLILNNNINCTLHAGETYGPESIHQAIHYCGAHRIGHGTKLKEDGDLLNYVNDHRIPLEICLSSNIQTKIVKNFHSHPLKFYYEYGIRVTLNTDNRLISDTTLTKEYLLASRYLNLGLKEVKDIIINGFKSAFLHYKDRVAMLKSTLEEMDSI
ncbi:MAG: adenosine deaminase [Fidelibacterota bacterium]